ncbi:hypothetical protein Tco_1100502 [Tanacetum coccineum]
MSIRALLAKERILKLIQAWDEKQIETWRLPELLPQLLNDSKTIEEERIERKQAANLEIQKEESFKKKDMSIEEIMSEKIDDEYERDCEIKIEQLLQDYNGLDIEMRKKERILMEEKSLVISRRIQSICDDDEDDSISLRDIYARYSTSKAITPDLPTKEPEYSLSMGDEHLSTIPEKESDELIKSSVENLVPIPSESEVTSDKESECDMPVCDDFTIFSNPLYDSNDDFSSSDDESLSDEDVPMENFKIYSNPLFDDEEIISPKIDPHHFNAESNLIESLLNRDILIDFSPKFYYLLEELSGELAHINPIPPGIEKADFDLEEEIRLVENLLYDNSSPRPPEELNSTESFLPSHIPVEDNSEGDNLFLGRLLHDDPTPLPDIPSPTHVTFPFEDHHDLDFTCVVRVFLPFFTYPVTSSFLLSSGSEDTIFDPGISTFHFSSLKPVAYENPMVIFPFFCFCPKDKGIRGESS